MSRIRRPQRTDRRSRRLGSIEREILESLTTGDLLYGFLLSATSTRRMYRLAQERAKYRYRRKRAIERLKELAFVRARGERLTITQTGHRALGIAVSDTHALLGNVPWDRKWRIVAFDIPEKYADLRDKIREILKKAGFEQLQQSVWVFPHECRELVQLIQEESQLSQHVLYGVLESIENEGRLKKLFNL